MLLEHGFDLKMLSHDLFAGNACFEHFVCALIAKMFYFLH